MSFEFYYPTKDVIAFRTELKQKNLYYFTFNGNLQLSRRFLFRQRVFFLRVNAIIEITLKYNAFERNLKMVWSGLMVCVIAFV